MFSHTMTNIMFALKKIYSIAIIELRIILNFFLNGFSQSI